MKSFILLLTLSLSLEVLSQDVNSEPGWKTKTRNVISRILGPTWAEKIVGAAPKAPEMPLPEIPKLDKKSTDISTYTKIYKAPTEFDQLPPDKRRQFDYKFLQELFQVTRKTAPKDEDLASWMNTLDQGGSREGIYQALVLDEVYAALENMNEKPSKRLLEFTLNFSQKFLNQTFKEESISQLNSYSLKRILTEKFLDLMEYYESKDLDLIYRWYAVFSSDLATEYSPMLRSEMRLESSPEFHYEWAKAMPIQHIKSEVIIKIHSVMNGLQVL